MHVRKKIFQHEDSPVLKQVYQGGCAVSVLGGFQNPTRKSPEQAGVISSLSLV